MSVRTFQSIVDEARLVASPPDAVVRYLEERGAELVKHPYMETTDEAFEQALLDRHDPLIDLALARWCKYDVTGRALLLANRGDTTHAQAIRLSLLANEAAGAVAIFGGIGETIADWLPSTSDEGLTTLFSNPSLRDEFLEVFFTGGLAWQCLSEAQRLTVLRALPKNPRMSKPYDQSFADGYAEHVHNKVFESAWKLAGTVPTTAPWGFALGWLFDVLLPIGYGIEDPLALAARWNVPDDEGVKYGQLSSFQNVRKGLARLALKKSPKRAEEFLASEDPALRAAVYSSCGLGVEQIQQAIERDPDFALDQMLYNVRLWRRQEERDALRAGVWTVVQADPRSDLMPHNLYNSMSQRMEREHPDWFVEITPDDSEALDVPATRGDVQRVLDSLNGDGQASAFQSVVHALQTLNKRVGWVWWFSLGALVVAVGHRL